MFSWKPIYVEAGRKLLAYRTRQNELLAWLHDMKKAGLPVVSLMDSKPQGTPIKLGEIDPFTFFANFNRGIKDEHRIAILHILKDKLKLSAQLPQDFDGIPVANKQKAWFFPSAYERDRNAVSLLWKFAEDVVRHEPSELQAGLFEGCLQIKQVGLAKLTMGMFWLQPDRYIALDQVNRAYLEEEYDFDTGDLKPKSLKGYLATLETARHRTGKDLTRLSSDAYTHAMTVSLDAAAVDTGFLKYLERLSEEAAYSIGDLVEYIKQPERSGESEITNRTIHQKELQELLALGGLTKEQLKTTVDKLWALSGLQDVIRRSEYFKSEEVMSDVSALMDESSGIPIVVRIRDFVEAAAAHGYSPASGEEFTLPAQFASVLLSSRFPDRFVDFRLGRWNDLYKGVTNSKAALLRGKHYGHLLVRAGAFASILAKTPTFKKFFGESNELWTVAGVAWSLKDGAPKPPPARPSGPKRYWLGGLRSSKKTANVGEFLAGNYWQHTYPRKSSTKNATKVWTLFDQIKAGDELAIRSSDAPALKIEYVGQVTDVSLGQGRTDLKRLERSLYKGKQPASADAENWELPLTEITRRDDINMIFGHEVLKREPLPAKNIILYGPPGTGKTHALCTEYRDRFTQIGAPKSKEQAADELVAEMSWWEVSSMVLLDLKNAKVSDMLAHPLMKARIKRSTSANTRSAVWAHLQMHTKRECEHVAYTKRYEPLIFLKTKDSRWSIDPATATAEVPELQDALEKWKGYTPSLGDVTRRFEFTTFHQSYSYEDFVEGIKPVLETDAGGDLAYEIKPGLFRQIAQRAKNDPDHDYALFIDEINRGNIAGIFGELITLLEEDKRLGARFELKARLPYSREEFGVPSNLFIIGTMNTADRSVEALDAALRRRFWFVPFPPEAEQLPEEPLAGLNIELRPMLTVINARLERLLDRDHCIGHSYLMGLASAEAPLKALQQAFANKILPLLEEYFYGDPEKIGLVLGAAFVKQRPKQQQFAKSEWDHDEEDDRESFDRVDPMTLDAEAFRAIYA